MRLLAIWLLFAALAGAQAPAPVPATPGPKAPAQGSAQAGQGSAGKASGAVDPDEGSIEGDVYTSDFFHFTYRLPEGFSVDEDFLAGETEQSNSAFVLLAAYGPFSAEDKREVVVIMADRETTTPEAYVQKITADYAQKQGFDVVKTAYPVTLGGRPFYRADFQKQGTLQSAVFTSLRGYIVGFSLAAPDQAALQDLLESLNSVKFLSSPVRKSGPAPSRPANPSSKSAPPPSSPR